MRKTIGISCLVALLVTGLMTCSCAPEKKGRLAERSSANSLIKYAKGFDILDFNEYKKLVIKSPYPDAPSQQEFFILPKGSTLELPGKVLAVPLEKVVATSTTHIPMLEAIEAENWLVGFPTTDFITSDKTNARIRQRLVADIGNSQQLNTELLISMQPDAVIAFSMGKASDVFGTIERTGIPVIYNGDWLEETPLGRAEWIKFFGLLFDRDEQADSIFNSIEAQYIEARSIAARASENPTVLSGVLYKDKWNLPAGRSFTARLFEDANTTYLWKESPGTGSLVLSFEAVYDKAEKADLWIGSGYYTSFSQLEEANPHYSEFQAFKKRSVFTFSKKRGDNGGVVYFELAPIMPHVVLKDLIKVAHPELLPGYRPFFLERLDPE